MAEVASVTNPAGPDLGKVAKLSGGDRLSRRERLTRRFVPLVVATTATLGATANVATDGGVVRTITAPFTPTEQARNNLLAEYPDFGKVIDPTLYRASLTGVNDKPPVIRSAPATGIVGRELSAEEVEKLGISGQGVLAVKVAGALYANAHPGGVFVDKDHRKPQGVWLAFVRPAENGKFDIDGRRYDPIAFASTNFAKLEPISSTPSQGPTRTG